MQADPGGGLHIELPSVNWAELIPQLVGYFFDAIGRTITERMEAAVSGLWGGDHNVIGQTPLDLVWSFGPIHDQVVDVQNGARAILIFALILVGLRSMLGGMLPHIHPVSEFAEGVLPAVVALSAFPLVIPLLIGLTNSAATAVAHNASASAFVSGNGMQDPLLSAVIYLILLFFAVRLLIKAIWRIGFLAVLMPVGMAACALYAIPQTRWLLSWWAKMWGGLLLAQIPSVFALSVGLGMAAGGGGLGAAVWSIGFLQLAHDLYDLLPFGHPSSQGSPIGAAALGIRTAGGLVGLAGVGAVSAGAVASSMRGLGAMDRASATERYYGYD